MPFDFQRADTSVRLHGVLPQTIFPVEISIYSYCTLSCSYCYSNRNRDVNGRDLHLKNPTALVLNRLDRYLDSEFSPFGFFLREKYPVCFSNATDPFQRDEKIYRSSETILKWCRQHEVPLFIQTKGNVLHEEFDRYAPYLIPGKDVVYLSITHQDDATRKRIEPGALSIPKRWELVSRLRDHGIPVVVACNPYLRDWVPDIDLFCRTCADHDVLGIWFEVLHLTAAQAQHIPLFYKDTVVAKANLQPVYTLSIIEQFISSCLKHGLDFFPSPRWDAYFHDVAAYPECTSPDLFNGKSLDFNFEILRSIAETSKIYNSPVYFTWADIVAFLSASGVPNPILDTSPFWMPYNTNLRADHRCFRAKLTKRAPFYEILRYFYNHPYENQNFIWYHPRVGVLFDVAKNLYVSDHDGDLIGIHDPQMTLTSSFTIDQASLDLDSLVRWDVQSWLDEEN